MLNAKIKKSMIVIAVTSVLTLSGCQTTRTNAMTGESETNSATSGAAIGCFTGALIGAIANKGKGAAIGCVAGGGVGLAVGYDLDQQESALRQELVRSGVQVKREGDKIKLIMDGDISFETGKTILSPSIKPALRSVVKVMNKFQDTDLIVSGHTDSKGNQTFNQQLSEARAKTVQSFLNQSGLSRSRTYAEGYGELVPLCTNETAQGRACNRRVELTIIPKS